MQWIGYLSSNGVYGDHDGAFVDETTSPVPSSDRGKRRLAAEQEWQAFARHLSTPRLMIFRLPGIYGPGRSALDSVRSGSARRIVKPGQVFSRMHVDDIARAVIAGMNTQTHHTVFNLCDDVPSPPQDVITHACELLGVSPPPEIALDDADISEMGRSFYADNKRVRNTRMKEVLGVSLLYPDYKAGLAAILKAGG